MRNYHARIIVRQDHSVALKECLDLEPGEYEADIRVAAPEVVQQRLLYGLMSVKPKDNEDYSRSAIYDDWGR